MGNRGTVGWSGAEVELNLYLHWDSEPEFVQALLDYCAIMGYRTPEQDPWYGIARLAQIAGNTIDPSGGLSMGVTTQNEEWDNGHYDCIGWKIAKQYCYERPGVMPHIDESLVSECIRAINRAQPDSIRMEEAMLEKEHDKVRAERLEATKDYE